MRIHIPQIPHTLPTRAFSHCAFTQKARLLPGMLARQGLETIAYGTGDGHEVESMLWVSLMDEDEYRDIVGPIGPTEIIGTRARLEHPIYQQFNLYLRDALAEHLEPGDVIALPFGTAHLPAVKAHVWARELATIETGIGYADPFAHFRVYESEAWRHWCLGNEARDGTGWESPRREWVVPNYYDGADWPTVTEIPASARSTVVYLGRLEPIKGLDLLPMLAERHPEITFVICGQGDPTRFTTQPNVVYEPPITGRDRARYLSEAVAAIFPSRFVEPFCGAAVEAMLCGTPVITSDFGAFTETVIDGVTGIRCRGLATWERALESVGELSREYIGQIAHARFTLPVVGARYAKIFNEVGERMAVLAGV